MAVILKSVDGSLSFAGAIQKQTRRTLAAALSFAGTLSRATGKNVNGGLSFAGAVIKSVSRILSAVLSTTGGLNKTTNRSIAATLSFVGTLTDNSKVISGVTRNSLGDILGTALVKLFRTSTDLKTTETTSDVDGIYSIRIASPATHYLVSYKIGSPDVAGTTVNTIVGV